MFPSGGSKMSTTAVCKFYNEMFNEHCLSNKSEKNSKTKTVTEIASLCIFVCRYTKANSPSIVYEFCLPNNGRSLKVVAQCSYSLLFFCKHQVLHQAFATK